MCIVFWEVSYQILVHMFLTSNHIFTIFVYIYTYINLFVNNVLLSICLHIENHIVSSVIQYTLPDSLIPFEHFGVLLFKQFFSKDLHIKKKRSSKMRLCNQL